MERQMEKLKDRTESFDDLSHCGSHGLKCRLKHIFNWANLFWLHYQAEYQSAVKGIKEETMLS